MRLRQDLKLLALVFTTIFPAVVARRGGRGGSAAGGAFNRGGSNSNLSLEPLTAAIFALCIIFAFLTAIQAIIAAFNIRKRVIKQPPSIALPEFNVGGIFPAFLLLSTMTLTTAYVLHGTFWGLRFNRNAFNRPRFDGAYLNAWSIMGFLTDILLVSALFALISNRNKVLFNSSGMLRGIKAAIDAVSVIILLALSMAYIGLRTEARTRRDARTARDVYLAYTAFFLIAVLNITISSMVSYARSKRSTVNDHKILLYTAFVISPLFIIYALYPIVVEGLQRSGVSASPAQWDLAGLVIGCVTEFIIIGVCLTFGMPPRLRRSKRSREPEQAPDAGIPPHKESHEA